MRRYRFGRTAMLFATLYVAAIIASGVRALTTGDPALLREIVAGGWDTDLVPYAWWVELLMVAGGILQGWAYWQILRGRPTGAPAVNDRPVRLLRAALYLSVTCTLLYELPLPYQWWFTLPADLLQIAVVGLFFLVLAGALPRWLRLLGLAAGLADAAMTTTSTIAYGLGQYSLLSFTSPYQLGTAVYLLWLICVLAGQSRDARWSRGTLRMGVASAVLSLLSSRGHSFMTIGGSGVDLDMVLIMVLSVLTVFGAVWQARSAHDLGTPPPPPPSPVTAVRVAPARAWPPAAVAVLLPLIPAAVNLGNGMPAWNGPRGVVDDLFHGSFSYPATTLWVALDLLVGVGAPAALILVAVLRRTRRLLRTTMLTLLLVAAAGIVTAFTTRFDEDWRSVPEMAQQRLALYPDGLFTSGNGKILFGISPAWYSAALATSAFVLFLLYRFPRAAPRPRHQVLAAVLAACAALCFLPVADQARGPLTTAEDCAPAEPWESDGEPEPPPTGPRAFICAVRRQNALPFAATAPDEVLLDHGRRLCAVYTRNDPRELARLREGEGLDVRGMSGVLAGICPAADAEITAAQAADDREFDEFTAEEQRKCDATPRHRPLITPARAIRVKEPEWPETGLELYGEFAGEGRETTSGPVSAGPGHVRVSTHSDFHVCVTVETYTRRPPVETKGWDSVVEVGYADHDGEMIFMDGLSGSELPDLSLNGRKGHYRIRVHFGWFPWKGERYGTQRLLIMAYPGPGDKVVTYRRPPKRR